MTLITLKIITKTVSRTKIFKIFKNSTLIISPTKENNIVLIVAISIHTLSYDLLTFTATKYLQQDEDRFILPEVTYNLKYNISSHTSTKALKDAELKRNRTEEIERCKNMAFCIIAFVVGEES